MELVRGRQSKALKVVVYGSEGIGKSTFANCFPEAVFADTEGSTTHMDVVRTPTPRSWQALLDQVRYFIQHPEVLGTFVLDTADWAEKLCIQAVCAKAGITGIEDFGYGKGYIYVEEEFARLLHLLDELVCRGIHVCITAHAMMRKFEQPDEMGAYDRWELKLSKKVAPLCKEWADLLIFANYKTLVVNVDNKGAAKGKNKASGGQRVMYTTHHPCWDAKNRFGLPEEMPFDFGGIAHLFQQNAPMPQMQQFVHKERPPEPEPVRRSEASQPPVGVPGVLWELMEMNNVTEAQIRHVVAKRGYYPKDTPIENYDPAFIDGVLIAAWEQVFNMIKEDM